MHEPVSPTSLDIVVKSLQNVAMNSSHVAWGDLDLFVREKRPLDYKKSWADTSAWAEELKAILGGPGNNDFDSMFERVLRDGNWYGAVEHKLLAGASVGSDQRPWVVLVTGLNGIRKTTSLYQPWFRDVLKEALGEAFPADPSLLPVGANSFFRQLDYMIATLASDEFRDLYSQAAAGLPTSAYSALKDGIFKRHRTIAEILGVLLLRCAQDRGLNALVESSGRDIASFDYIESIFVPRPEYRKLVLRFTIDDIGHAERSVDARMADEMRAGGALATARTDNARAVVAVNAGGPYGSEVLKSVQADGDKVWASVLEDREGRRGDWLMASIQISGSTDPAGWTARAILPDGQPSARSYPFQR